MIKTYQKGATGLFQRQKNSKNFPEGGDRFIHRPVYFPLYGILLLKEKYKKIKIKNHYN